MLQCDGRTWNPELLLAPLLLTSAPLGAVHVPTLPRNPGDHRRVGALSGARALARRHRAPLGQTDPINAKSLFGCTSIGILIMFQLGGNATNVELSVV